MNLRVWLNGCGYVEVVKWVWLWPHQSNLASYTRFAVVTIL